MGARARLRAAGAGSGRAAARARRDQRVRRGAWVASVAGDEAVGVAGCCRRAQPRSKSATRQRGVQNIDVVRVKRYMQREKDKERGSVLLVFVIRA